MSTNTSGRATPERNEDRTALRRRALIAPASVAIGRFFVGVEWPPTDGILGQVRLVRFVRRHERARLLSQHRAEMFAVPDEVGGTAEARKEERERGHVPLERVALWAR